MSVVGHHLCVLSNDMVDTIPYLLLDTYLHGIPDSFFSGRYVHDKSLPIIVFKTANSLENITSLITILFKKPIRILLLRNCPFCGFMNSDFIVL